MNDMRMLNIKTAVALGFFDGVHLGHRSLIEKARQIAAERQITSTAYTFDRHAAELLGRQIQYILPQEEKVRRLSALRVDLVYVQEINRDFLSMEPEAFVEKILKNTLNAAWVVAGENYRFGKGKAGDAKLLKMLCGRYGINCDILPFIRLEDTIVSSSKIRAWISEGKLDAANSVLGYSFYLRGTVQMGRQDGRKMGFPTANLVAPDNQILPPNGVYATVTQIGDQKYDSITNVGIAPTFGGTKKVVETNLFEFNKDIYGRQIKVAFLGRIRTEEKFSSVEHLATQIQMDIRTRKKFRK